MQSEPIHVVLLSGGSGTRLWPLSNAARSKQFLKVLRNDEGKPESMVQRTVRLVCEQCPEAQVTVATSAAQVDALEHQLGESLCLSLEPERRDTAPAIMLAASHVAWAEGASRDATVVVMPIDTYADPAYYQCIRRLDEAVRSRVADLVLLGVEPLRPSTKFGYIVPARAEFEEDVPSPVERFVEKPDRDRAQALVTEGALWNCGVFAFRLGYLLDIVSGYCDAASYEELRARYGELPRNSFDYEVVEKAPSVAVIRYAGAWKDIGTWGTLCEELVDATSGNVWLDEDTISDVHVVNETHLPLVVAGIDHAAIAATADGILVAGKGADARVRDLANKAALKAPMCERRHWGSYRVSDVTSVPGGTRVSTRVLEVDAGERLDGITGVGCVLSWTVAGGMGKLAINEEVRAVAMGDVVRIGPQTAYAVRALDDLLLVEVCVDEAGTKGETNGSV